MAKYTVLIEAGSHQTGIWQAVHPAENVEDNGTAQDVAEWTDSNQTLCQGGGYRIRVWHGHYADAPGSEPAFQIEHTEAGDRIEQATGSYVAHVITEADQLGDPEIIVMTQADTSGAAEPIANLPLLHGDDPMQVLDKSGWRIAGTPTHDPYTMVDVEPVDWIDLVRQLTAQRKTVQAEATRAEQAWRQVVADAMRAKGVPRAAVAAAAEISEAWAFEIRKGA